MNADQILKRDAELRTLARNTPWRTESSTYFGGTRLRTSADYEYPATCLQEPDHPQMAQMIAYLANIAAAERALIEAVGAWVTSDIKGGWESEAAAADAVEQAYRALLAAMEAGQQ